jgi:Cysteine-rich secretory protein family
MVCGTSVAAQPGFQSGERDWNGKSAARGADMMKRAMIEVHARARKAYGVAPLTWDESLAADSRRYALAMAKSGVFAHDKQVGIKPQQGENLFKGTSRAFDYTTMAQLWVDERKDFRPGRFPDVVKSGDWRKVGHYTQIIWPTTMRFGCATAGNRQEDFLVCRYLPAGNVYGVTLK